MFEIIVLLLEKKYKWILKSFYKKSYYLFILSFVVERWEVLKFLIIKVYLLYSNMNYFLYKVIFIYFDWEWVL